MNNKSFVSLYVILFVTALALIFTGIFLKQLIGIFNVNIASTYLHIGQAAFILSGFGDIALIFYAKKKLS